MSTKIAISEITADWLAANIKGKELLAACAVLMGSKRRSKKSASGDSDKPKREVSEGLAAHHQHTAAIAALVKTFKEQVGAGDREFDMETLPKSAHLRVTSYLKSEGTIDAVIEEDDVDAVEAAIQFLVENPEWKPAKKTAAKKPAPKKEAAKKEVVKTTKSTAAPSKGAKKQAAAKKQLSDSEDEVPVVVKAASKAKPKPKASTKVVSSDSEDEVPVVTKKSTKTAAAETSNLKAIEWEGKEYFWDEDEGDLFKDKDGKTKVGSFDGTQATFE